MTIQSRDTLLLKKEIYYISNEPLAEYLKQAKLRYELVAPHTGCWKGYTSKWAVDNKKLFLIEWHGYILNFKKVGFHYLFPDEEFVFADWCSGTIKLDMGEIVDYRMAGYHLYEGSMFLTFENGILVDETVKWLTQEEIDKIKDEKSILPF